ncbi:MAG TPA: tetratricopeptide repeat protein, partial [Leptospiraceae bacterium]|nr:tetratricopeptide repeat protein [Leptospiraceae bacterium]
YYRGLTFEKTGDNQNAIQDFSTAIELNPKFSKAIEERAKLYVESGEPEKALLDYEKILKENPNSASLNEKKKLVERVLEDSFDMEKKPDFANVFYMSGLAKVSVGNYEGALEDYNKAIKINPDNSNAYYYRSLVKMQLSETAGINMKTSALRDQEKSLSINPEDAKTHFFSAITRKAISQNKDFILPGMERSLPWAEFYGISYPAEELGGDYFYFYTDSKSDSDRFSFTIGDVSGKGTKAALFASIALQLKDEARKNQTDSEAVIDFVNKFLCRKTGGVSRTDRRSRKENKPKPMFITSIFANFHKNGEIGMNWTNAGHLKPFLLRKGQFKDLIFSY